MISATLALPGNGCTVTTFAPGDLPCAVTTELATVDRGACAFKNGEIGTECLGEADIGKGLAVTVPLPGRLTPLVGTETT